MRAYAVALLALLAVSQLSHPAWAQEDDVEDMEGEDGDYGDDGYGGEGYDEDNEGYGDDEGGGPPPPAEITELKSVEDVRACARCAPIALVRSRCARFQPLSSGLPTARPARAIILRRCRPTDRWPPAHPRPLCAVRQVPG